ncbi:glycosyltransferase family 4 protein [Prosthecochloris vibrioformis]|uniref:Glycosyltransferase family 4 protein n=2 Tax=Prosthecochloris vibrioformis TaxID=1098 RepID=A0A5C4S116_PROVB|nr:glycosyltransferase family 4 protein [Prosthecochloris vibrioformis]
MSYLPILFGYHASNLGNSHVPLSLCRYWAAEDRPVRLTVPGADPDKNYPWLTTVADGWLLKAMYKIASTEWIRGRAEKLFMRNEKNASIVYLWAGLSLEVYEIFHKRGCRILMERINCHRQTSRNIIQQAADHWGIPVTSPISDEDIAIENRKLQLADTVFCPSPMVTQSMLANQVASSKLLATSYGWEEQRFPDRFEKEKINQKPVFLFVGKICVRKGIPLLLAAWKKADIDAKLVLCGHVAPEIQDHMEPLESFPNVEHVAYTKDVGKLYRTADVFVFPSLEEGGPMVTYEAMAHGLPSLVTAMGAGAIATHGENALILPNMDVDAWAEAMARMAHDQALREEMGNRARKRAEHFTWPLVAQQRAELLEKKYSQLWNSASSN